MKITRKQLRKLIAESLLVESEDRIEQLKREFDQLMNLLEDPKLDNAIAEDYFTRAGDIQAEIAKLVNQKYNTPNEPQVIDRVDMKRKEFEDSFDDFGNASEIVPYQQTNQPNFSKKAFEKEIGRRDMIRGSLAGTAAAAFAIKTGLDTSQFKFKQYNTIENAIEDWFATNFVEGSTVDRVVGEEILLHIRESSDLDVIENYMLELDYGAETWTVPLSNHLHKNGFADPTPGETIIDEEYWEKEYGHGNGKTYTVEGDYLNRIDYAVELFIKHAKRLYPHTRLIKMLNK
jgi:hypothetical protein